MRRDRGAIRRTRARWAGDVRVTVRLVGATCVGVLVIIAAFAFFQIREERQRLHRDLERRASFTGAAREVRDAVLVNPYDVDGTADAIRAARELPAEERRARMRRMRHQVRGHNVYRWAGLLLDELARIPADAVEVRG